MRLVRVQLIMTESQVTALVMIKRYEIKGWGFPDDVSEPVREELHYMGLIGYRGHVTLSGELVIQSTGNDTVVTQ